MNSRFTPKAKRGSAGRQCPLRSVVAVLLVPFVFILLFSCSSINCPVQTSVVVNYGIPDTLKDTLWVLSPRQGGDDTLLLNRGVNLTSFSLPISYQSAEDTLLFVVEDSSNGWTIDSVFLSKTDIPHFESVECTAHFFHQLTGVRHTHHGIDSIVINSPTVNYDQSPTHIRLYFKARP